MKHMHGWLVLIWLTKSHLCMCIHLSCVSMYHVYPCIMCIMCATHCVCRMIHAVSCPRKWWLLQVVRQACRLMTPRSRGKTDAMLIENGNARSEQLAA